MRRYIVLLLITGIVWAQTDYDKLILKDGTTYFGEYSKTEGKIVFFRHHDSFSFHPISIKLIKKLQLKDGHYIIGIDKNISTLEEYQKLSTKEKAIYDAKSKNLGKWYLFAPMSTILFGGCVLLKEGKILGSPIFFGGSLAASLTIPYFVLNRKEKINFPKSILTDSEKEIYKQAYSKKLQKRKLKHYLGPTIVTGVAVSLMVGQINSGLNMSGGGGGGKGFTGAGP